MGNIGSMPYFSGNRTVIFLGDFQIGKTSLLKLVEKNYELIFGKDSKISCTNENPKRYQLKLNCKNMKCTFGEEEDKINPKIEELKCADTVVLLFSLNNSQTLNNVKNKWIKHINNYCDAPIILLGTHKDERNKKLKNFSSNEKMQKSKLNYYESSMEPSTNLDFSINNLPCTILFSIFDYLDLNDLRNCSSVNKFWNNIASHHYVWENREKPLVEKNAIKNFLSNISNQKDSPLWKKRFADYFEIDNTEEATNLKELKKLFNSILKQIILYSQKKK